MNEIWHDLINFFRPEYLFEPDPGEFVKYGAFFIVFFTILGSIGIIIGVYARVAKKLPEIKAYFYRRVATMLLTGAVLGLLYVFVREQEVLYLSSRLVLLLLLVGMVMWVGFLIYWGRQIPEKMAAKEKQKEIEKYLPKPKKKGK